MSVLGFQEVCENAVQVCVQETPELVIPVATPEGMILLKLIAWTNRPSDMRRKDASDILYLLKNYEAIPAVKDAMYEDAERMGYYDWDTTLAASNELGTAARRIARDATAQMINEFFTDQHKTLSLDLLITEMCGNNVANEYDRNSQLLQALVDGFMMRK